MRTHDQTNMATLLFMLGVKDRQLKTENDLLIICDNDTELFVTDCVQEAMDFVRDLPFHWQSDTGAAGREGWEAWIEAGHAL